MSSFSSRYGFLAKLLHKAAFNSVKLQLNLAENETEQHQGQLDAIAIDKPVYITGMPRAGTTILLEVLAKTGCFSYHSYQDMPFVLTPLMWANFSQKFAHSDELQQRAHNDGIMINQQSPEAFEEMLYMAHFADFYQGDWLSCDANFSTAKFEQFYRQHLQKLIFRDGGNRRYLAKNNLNICRLGHIRHMFADARLVVPFRQPLQHAYSLWYQHRHFSKLHQTDGFARQYMAGIGHFDFGDNLKPINFNHWLEHCEYEQDELDFWLAYWLHGYQYLLENAPQDTLFVCFERLSNQPEQEFERLSDYLAIEPQKLAAFLPQIRQVKEKDIAVDDFNLTLVTKAQQVYQQLLY